MNVRLGMKVYLPGLQKAGEVFADKDVENGFVVVHPSGEILQKFTGAVLPDAREMPLNEWLDYVHPPKDSAPEAVQEVQPEAVVSTKGKKG